MAKLKTLDDLRQLRENLKYKVNLRENSDNPDLLPQIKIGMATCGIASGAKQIMESFYRELDARSMQAIVTQTGCMGFCYAEPTVEVTLPGKEAVTFGQVDEKKVIEILELYILQGQLVNGLIPINYKTIEEKQ